MSAVGSGYEPRPVQDKDLEENKFLLLLSLVLGKDFKVDTE